MALPRIISVDDHVFEPPNLWQDRLPAKLKERGPRIERTKLQLIGASGGGMPPRMVKSPDGSGVWGDVWLYDGLFSPLHVLSGATGLENITFRPTTFDEILPGCWQQAPRLADMDSNHVEASICFPNTLPRFCGQTFYEAKDHDLALLCVQAYNDWMLDEWCAGEGQGRLIPLTMIPLWDPELAAAEVRRNAARGSIAITFPENPYPLGLPSIHDDGHWDPVFQACDETNQVICMHIGSSSRMPSTAPRAPFIISSTLTFQNAMGSMLDFIFSGTLARFPNLRLAYSEGQVGWMPYIIERMDKLWHERDDDAFGSPLPNPPSSYIRGRIWGCIFDDETGLHNRDVIGMEQICFETDFPHADSTFPRTVDIFNNMVTKAGLNEREVYQLARGNAIEAFGLTRVGISA